jgi:4-hydroxy-2-oxoheptanedioate aldolase
MSLSLPPNRALAKLRANELVKLYVTGKFATPRQVDFVCRSDVFDALGFGLEHFELLTQEVAALNLVARAFPVTTVARLRASDYQAVMRVLETGVGGIICSQVNSAEEARRIVQWSKFNHPSPAPGEITGLRGWNGGNIDAGYATVPPLEYIRHQNTQTMILAQLETETAWQEATAIAGVPGIDALFFDPAPFTAAIGVPGQSHEDRVQTGAAQVARAAQAAGKAWGTVVADLDGFRRAYAQGARLICVGGDVDVMQLGLQELAKTFGGVPANVNGTATQATTAPVPARHL